MPVPAIPVRVDNPGMHGEYKMPGGKLVVADVEIKDGKLERVRVSGDFFLEPDAALDVIDAAARGTAIPIREPELQQRIEQRLQQTFGDDLMMYGVSAAAIATAVARAVEAA